MATGGARNGHPRAPCRLLRVEPMKTHFAKKEDFGPETRRWYHVDAADQVLGRLATEVAVRLMGKDRPDFTPHVDTGAYVVVTNAEKVHLSGKKLTDKQYKRYSGYSGGLKEIPAKEMLEKHPDLVFKRAEKGMLPKNRLNKHFLKKLKVYAGPEHPHQAQKPQTLEIQ